MKIISFKNGDKIKVEDWCAENLNTRILSPEGAKQWQTFTDKDTDKVVLMINLSEVSHISSKENTI